MVRKREAIAPAGSGGTASPEQRAQHKCLRGGGPQREDIVRVNADTTGGCGTGIAELAVRLINHEGTLGGLSIHLNQHLGAGSQIIAPVQAPGTTVGGKDTGTERLGNIVVVIDQIQVRSVSLGAAAGTMQKLIVPVAAVGLDDTDGQIAGLVAHGRGPRRGRYVDHIDVIGADGRVVVCIVVIGVEHGQPVAFQIGLEGLVRGIRAGGIADDQQHVAARIGGGYGPAVAIRTVTVAVAFGGGLEGIDGCGVVHRGEKIHAGEILGARGIGIKEHRDAI